MNENEAGAHEHHSPEELENLKALTREHGRRIVYAALAAVLIAAGLSAYRGHVRRKAARAAAEFAQARSVPDLEAFTAGAGNSGPLAPLGRLRLAKAYFDAGNFDMAMSTYETFKTSYPEHEYLPAADLGMAHCLEARGQLEAALEAFDAFLEAQPGHYLSPQAVLGKARVLDELGRTQDARAALEEYVAGHQQDRWLPPLEELLEQLNRKLKPRQDGRQLTLPPPVPPVAPVPAAPAAADDANDDPPPAGDAGAEAQPATEVPDEPAPQAEPVTGADAPDAPPEAVTPPGPGETPPPAPGTEPAPSAP